MPGASPSRRMPLSLRTELMLFKVLQDFDLSVFVISFESIWYSQVSLLEVI